MKTTLSQQQISFFHKNGFIEFENIFSSDFCAALQKEVSSLVKEHDLSSCRDLFRKSSSIKNLFSHPQVIAILSQILDSSSLRMGVDFWISSATLPKERISIQDMFSIQPLFIGCLLKFDETPSEIVALKDQIGLIPTPQKVGNLLLFKPNLLLNWPALVKNLPGELLWAYAEKSAVYRENEKDPLTNALKKEGLGFGDPLSNQTHPMIFLQK